MSEWKIRQNKRLKWSLIFSIGIANVIMCSIYFIVGWSLLGWGALIIGGTISIIAKIKEKRVNRKC